MENKKIETFIRYKLVETREGLGMTQMEVAKKTGIKQSKISKIENGSKEIDASTLYILAKAYKKPIQFFFPLK